MSICHLPSAQILFPSLAAPVLERACCCAAILSVRRPSQVQSLFGAQATADQIPDEATISSTMNSLTGCMCNVNLQLVNDTLYPKLSYLLTGASSPYSSGSLEIMSNLTYSGVSQAVCTSCSGFVSKFLTMFTPAISLAISTPGAILSGRFYGKDGTLIAEDPPLASEGTFTNAQLDTLFTNVMPCICHHTDPESKARDLMTWWDATWRMLSTKTNALAPNGAWVLHPIIREALLGSAYCGSSSCRQVMNVLKDSMFAMQTSGTCSLADASRCAGGGTDAVCLTPYFGPKAAQKFPLRWFNMEEMVSSYSSHPELAYLDDRWLYWEACAATTECPVDVTVYKIVITYAIDATIETFDAAAFKSKLAAFLNKDATVGLVSADHISLEVTSGSIKVKATIETPLESVKDSVTLTLTNADTAALTAALGVTVLEENTVVAAEASTESSNTPLSSGVGVTALDAVEAATKSGDTPLSPGVLGAIIGGGVAFLALVIVIGAIVFLRIRKKKISSNNEAEVEVAAKLDGSETEASAKDVTIVVDGETVTNNEAEVEVAVKLDGSETEASGKRRRVYC